jgi:branched-chain amino acid transport system ATP-binding protein
MDLTFDVADTITVLNYGEVVFDGLPEAARGSQLLKDIYLGAWEDA